MGDTTGDSYLYGGYELPTHAVHVSGFYMDKYEVTKALWDEVKSWAQKHGYTFDYVGLGKATNHPVHTVNWYDAVKWCNARSEKEGRVPAYYINAERITVYRSGQVDVQNDWVNWNAGYRLPTEAEWERAGRGGLSGKRFPWGDTISHSQANYYSLWYMGSPYYSFDVSPTSDYHPGYDDYPQPYTSPVGSFSANGYSLYDIIGNVSEWCWDWWGSYTNSSQTDPRGPASGVGQRPERVVRGGSWSSYGVWVTSRGGCWPPVWNDDRYLGFRSILPPGPSAMPEAPAITDYPQSQTNYAGATARFSVIAIGSAPLSYQWQKNGIPLISDGRIDGATSDVLMISGTLTNDAGVYSVIVSNMAGVATSAPIALLTVLIPSGMALIPAGEFTMGDSFSEGNSDERPVHMVQISAFYMDVNLVTKALWDEVCSWSSSQGYSYDNTASGKAAIHPVHSVTWYDVVKWCNARSQKAGLTAVYYTDQAMTQVYKAGRVEPYAMWGASGYRLPTEAEWEYAARGGLNGKRFPFGDTISHSRANYSSSSTDYDVSPTRGYHPDYDNDPTPYTSPAGSFAPNGYGLFDMAGNLGEWCWDWYGSYSSASQSDPRGPSSGSSRILRGGAWLNVGLGCRIARREVLPGNVSENNHGFRSVVP